MFPLKRKDMGCQIFTCRQSFCLNVPDSAYGTTCFQDKLVDQINAILSDAHANIKSTSLIFQSAY